MEAVHILKRFIVNIAGSFFPTAHALVGYFEVTWHLTMRLFPVKISEQATLQKLWGQRVTVHCCSQMLIVNGHCSKVSSFKISIHITLITYRLVSQETVYFFPWNPKYQSLMFKSAGKYNKLVGNQTAESNRDFFWFYFWFIFLGK